MNPFKLDDAVVRDEAHVRVVRHAPRTFRAGDRATFEKSFAPGYEYLTERELDFFHKFSYRKIQRVAECQRFEAANTDVSDHQTAASVTTFDAGLCIGQWLSLRPLVAHGRTQAHPFEQLTPLAERPALDARHKACDPQIDWHVS